MTITGTNFTGATAVKFGTTAATELHRQLAPPPITATAPAGTAGTVDVTVTTPGGTSATSAADQFTYAAAPTVTAVSPTSGPAAGGTAVTITGTDFTGATAVDFGTTAATSFTVNSRHLDHRHRSGRHRRHRRRHRHHPRRHLGHLGGRPVHLHRRTDRHLASAPPRGPTAGGTTVTITGTNFTGATGVKFGTAAATGFTVVSATRSPPRRPAGTGTVDVTVTTPGGTSATSAADQFTYPAPRPSPPSRPPRARPPAAPR